MKDNQKDLLRLCIEQHLKQTFKSEHKQEMSDEKLAGALRTFDAYYEKVESFDQAQKKFNFKITIDQINEVNGLVAELEILSKKYYTNRDIKDIHTLEDVKVKMTQHLERLSTINDIITADIDYLEYILKAIRGEVIEQLETEKVKVTVIKERAYADQRYAYYAKQAAALKRHCKTINGRYWFYKDLWEQVKNSAATAKNLRGRSDQSGNVKNN